MTADNLSPLDRIAALEAGQRILAKRLDKLCRAAAGRKAKPYRSLVGRTDEERIGDINDMMRQLYQMPKEKLSRRHRPGAPEHLGLVRFSILASSIGFRAGWKGCEPLRIRKLLIRLLHKSEFKLITDSQALRWCGSPVALVIPRTVDTPGNRKDCYRRAMERHAQLAGTINAKARVAKPKKKPFPKGRRTKAADRWIKKHPDDPWAAVCECGAWLTSIKPRKCKRCECKLPTLE